MNSSLKPLLAARSSAQLSWSRSYYYKVKRTRIPPLQEPKESPYIVGPYLKPNYVPQTYLTEPLKPRFEDDFDHFIYEPIKVEADQERKIQLLLLKDVEGLGVAGQVVEAPYRYGASKLIALKCADYYTEFTSKWHKFGPKTFESASSAISPRTARLLRSQVFDLPISSTTKVEPWHISLALRLSGCLCPVSAVDKNSLEDFEDENGMPHVKCRIVINNHEKVEVKLKYRAVKQVEEGDESQ